MDPNICSKRNIHNRTEAEISGIINKWEKTPLTQDILDIRSLLQSAAITEVSVHYHIIITTTCLCMRVCMYVCIHPSLS